MATSGKVNGGIQETVKGSSDNRVRLEGGAGRSVLKNEKKGERNKQISQHRSQHECSILYDSHQTLSIVMLHSKTSGQNDLVQLGKRFLFHYCSKLHSPVALTHSQCQL